MCFFNDKFLFKGYNNRLKKVFEIILVIIIEMIKLKSLFFFNNVKIFILWREVYIFIVCFLIKNFGVIRLYKIYMYNYLLKMVFLNGLVF